MPRRARTATIVRMNATTATAPDQRPATGTWGWIGIAFGTLVVSVPTDLLITLLLTTTCGQPADPETVLQGRVALLIVLLLAALPWMIMVPMSRNGSRGAVFGMVALLPAVGFLLHGFTAGAWTSSWCIGG